MLAEPGKFLASEPYGVKPDVTTLQRGLQEAYQWERVWRLKNVQRCLLRVLMVLHLVVILWHVPGGEVVIDKVTADGFLEDVTAKGHYFKEKLEKMNEVESVSGLGMMIGITLKNKKAADVAAKAIDEGLMLLTAKEKVGFCLRLILLMMKLTRDLKYLKRY